MLHNCSCVLYNNKNSALKSYYTVLLEVGPRKADELLKPMIVVQKNIFYRYVKTLRTSLDCFTEPLLL